MEVFLIVWVVISILIAAGSLFYVGYDKREHWNREGFVINAIIIAILWPIILFAFVFMAPFYGIYVLGKYLASRR